MTLFEQKIKNIRSTILKEDVTGNEQSELPDRVDIEDDDQTSNDGVDASPQNEPQQTNSVPYTDREISILNVALEIFRSLPDMDIEDKNDLSDLFTAKDYDELLSRLISYADNLEL